MEAAKGKYHGTKREFRIFQPILVWTMCNSMEYIDLQSSAVQQFQ
jgi:hypothetical protein